MSQRLRFVLVSLVALAALVATLALGRWQLSRADEKLAMQALQLKRAELPALDAAQLLGRADAGELLHRRALIRGHWLTGATVHLEHRQMNGRTGFFLLTPLQPTGGGPAILVLRGWAPRNFTERAALPQVDTAQGQVEVAGVLAPAPSRLYDFGSAQEAGPIRQNLDLVSYSAELGRPLFELILRQHGDLPDGLLRNWPASNLGVDKHHGYAVQWFALSALILALYLWFQIVRPLRSPQ